ncbi:uncharacterized protein K02A2.6-like [Plodia interpunctella]|uniref:uncharacterized protein K02A2.6-like n=1 Tax=Plodia interpunctella TaxID=58824 RepID=UPI002368B681|nr:uncharacterized protein K02A2.6-like [Plodia interpunctella]
MPIGKVEQFDLSSKKWLAYIRRVEQFIALNEIKPELQVATLVTLVGGATYDLMCDLCAPSNPESKSFGELVKIVGDHLEPKRSEIAERHVFRQRRQNVGEPLSEYLQALKHLASTCNFTTTLEENLRDQFVSGLASDDMRSRIFAEQKITYKKAIELALALEAAERHAQTSGGAATTHTAASQEAGAARAPEPVHRVAAGGRGQRAAAAERSSGEPPSSQPARSYNCWRCGRNHRAEMCRFKNYSCDACGVKGHIKVMCKKKASRRVSKSTYSPSTRNQNYIASDEESESDIYNICVRGANDKPYMLVAQVNDREVNFELDTGSKLSAISLNFYNKNFSHLKILSYDISLSSYVGTPIESVGFIYVDVAVGNHTAKNLKLFVIKKGGPPLLGRSWLSKLKISNIQVSELLLKMNDIGLVDQLRREFPTVFATGLGSCIKKITLNLIDKNPIFIKARSLPLALRGPVERELARLEAEGTIKKVDYSEYGTPIVPVIKKSGEIRICGDYKVTVNPKLRREPYPLPRIEELFAALSGGEQFSKIDLTNAYQQLFLEKDSQACTAITTHVGTFVYTRTPFGLTCVPEKFQKFMEETLKGLKGVAVFLDDIACTGINRSEHISNLLALFNRLREVGLRIKLEKCAFLQDSITYVGFVIDKNGLHPDKKKIRAIVDAPQPKDVTQLKSFLGLVNYYGKFIPKLSTILHPLHQLLRKNVDWYWSDECDFSFNEVKKVVSGSKVLVHYNPELPVVLAVDSSSYGIGSVLSHRYPNGDERPICFASRTLNSAERAYSQLDKEALAIISGVSKHHQYLYGRHFIIKTDHKPLTFIFGPKYGLPQTAASRLQRYATKLAAYDFQIEFVKSRDNGNVDALSRLPLPEERKIQPDVMSYINYVEENIPISAKEIATKTQDDVTLKLIYNYLLNGWPAAVTDNSLKPYLHRKDCLTTDKGCILYNHRVVIPKVLRSRVLHELHQGHLGIVKMKNLSRSYVYWPQLDAEIETLCRACSACLLQRDAPPRATLHPWVFPTRPWQRLNLDFGEFQGRHYLISIDAHTKWIEVQRMSSTNANSTILKLRELFARFGLPSHIISDGGPPFNSVEFANYMKKNCITHTITSPYRPAGNGAAENAVKLVKRVMKKALHEGTDIDTAVLQFLFQYRNCEHSTTGVAPAIAMFGRRLRGRLDVLKPSIERAVEGASDRAGRARPGAERYVELGDQVLARDYRARVEKWAPATVVTRDAPLTYKVRLSDGREWKRHIDQLLPIRKSIRHSLPSNDVPSDSEPEVTAAEQSNTNSGRPEALTPDLVTPNQEIQLADSNPCSASKPNEPIMPRIRRACVLRKKNVNA